MKSPNLNFNCCFSKFSLRGSAAFVCFAIVIAVGTSPVAAQYGGIAPPPKDLAAGFDSINIEQSKEWLGVLAGPKFEGRGTGQPGYTKAAHWVSGKLAEFGLEPVGDNGTYFQMLPMQRRLPLIEECFLMGPNDLKIAGPGNLGFERFTDQQQTEGEAVFLNFSGRNCALNEDVSLRDKIVFYVADDEASQVAPFHIARKRPAAAIRVIEGEPNSISQLVRNGGRRRSTSVSGTINVKPATELVKGLSLIHI